MCCTVILAVCMKIYIKFVIYVVNYTKFAAITALMSRQLTATGYPQQQGVIFLKRGMTVTKVKFIVYITLHYCNKIFLKGGVAWVT